MRASRPDVNGDVPDAAADDADELALGVRRALVVEAAQGALGGSRVVVLDETLRDAVPGELRFLIGLHEEAAFVGEGLRLDDDEARDGAGREGEGHGSQAFPAR